jgi:hypothetical protein
MLIIMKKNVITSVLFIVGMLNAIITLDAQSINVVPNPNAPGFFTWSSGGELSGYAGTPIILNNSLVLEYNATTTSDPTQAKLQLAVYTGGDSLHVIPNPDAGLGVYFQSVQVVFNNKLFFIYLENANLQKLASFDGTSITLYPNPDGGLGYVGSPRILNNNLYLAYVNAAGVTQFGSFNGSGITLIPNPDNSTRGFFNNYSVVFNNKICSRYVTAAGPKQLANFDGTSWTLVPNPDNTATFGFQPMFPTNYHNKLYWIYYGNGNQYQYAVYDGVSTPTLIANPQDGSSNNGGIAGLPIVYNDTLFFQYYNTSNVVQLAKTGGTSISLVPNPDATTYGFWNTPVIYNNNLYIFYLPVNGTHHLAQYQATSNSLKVFPNPDGGLGYWDQPVVYDNQLYFMYYNAQSVFQLGYFGGNAIKLVPNPAGNYGGASGNNGYTGYPLIWNNLLYMQFGSVPYGNAGNLAFINGSTLPVTLVNFDGVIRDNVALLSWRTSNENSNKGFEVQKSEDGNTFGDIGFVQGTGTATSLINNYSFSDVKVFNGFNYYRLKQIDLDGNFTYSPVIKLDYSKFTWSILGNPVANNSWLQLQLDNQATISVQILSINGKIIQTINKGNIGQGTFSIPLDLKNASHGVYVVRLILNDKAYIKSIIR